MPTPQKLIEQAAVHISASAISLAAEDISMDEFRKRVERIIKEMVVDEIKKHSL